jgi:hypothetical protein
MHDDADPAPGRSGGEQRAEEAHVRVRRSEDALSEWLRRYPDGCSHRSRDYPSHHVVTIRSSAGWAIDASRCLRVCCPTRSTGSARTAVGDGRRPLAVAIRWLRPKLSATIPP